MGVDLIATDLPLLLTSVGNAFSRFDMTPVPAATTDGCGDAPPAKKRKTEGGSVGDEESEPFYINIRDRKYARDLRPLVSCLFGALSCCNSSN